MTDIPKENIDNVFNNSIQENLSKFNELGLKNASDNSHNIYVKNYIVQDSYKNSSNGVETNTLNAVNKLNNSNDDIIEELTNVNSTLNEEIRNNTTLNLSIWNIYRVSFKKVTLTFIKT